MMHSSNSPCDLQSIVEVVARWADHRPVIKTAFIFGSYARGEARADSDLDVAICLRGLPTREATEDWTQQHESGFAELRAALEVIGVPKLSVHDRQNDHAWPAIREAAQNPVLILRKVICCATLPKQP